MENFKNFDQGLMTNYIILQAINITNLNEY